MQYRAIVFKHRPASPDFTVSTRVELPGRHTKDAAWVFVHAAMRAGPDIIGGEVVPAFAEIDAEADAETLSKSERHPQCWW